MCTLSKGAVIMMSGHVGTIFRSMWKRITQKLVNKLILLFTSVIILVVGSLTIISYQMIEKESVNHSIASTTNNLLLVNQNLEDYLEGMQQLALPQLRYNDIMNAIANENRDYAARMVIENYLRNMFYSRNDLEAIYLYVADRHQYYVVTRETYNITVRKGINTDIPKLPWYKEAMASTANESFQSFVESRSDMGYVAPQASFMAYHRVLRSIASRHPQAVLSFYYNTSAVDEIMRNIPLGKGDQLMLISPKRVPFYVNSLPLYERMRDSGVLAQIGEGGSGRVTWSDSNQEYLVVYDAGEKDGWQLIKPIPYRQIYEAATTTRNWSYVIGALFLGVSIILVTLTSNAITRPLHKLSTQMKRFSTGDFEARALVKGHDEIAYLSLHFNEMVQRTEELINERYRMKLVEKNAILKALEAEINPHFLYNALQAISTQALKRKMFDMADMVDALAQTLRYSINGKDIVAAREELKHIERYIGLQKARFGARLQVEVIWEDTLMELPIPRLSVQTLVENSIKHALEKVSSDILIVISAESGATDATISVRDNGPGISEDKLKIVLDSFHEKWEERESEHIGLKNLNTRLKLLYGDQAGLFILTDETGTEMRMQIPRGGVDHV
ncbi:cache domain-containing sensor histidine kinase [Paenibacillus polymyxa]|uniref:cache domain-containing sensor histidine kinase n=1 Tax=Paenibacillus TaxID=44249 RepID=UPI000F4D4D9B|nr:MULTISPECIES: histidine kinase [Paenibacillus]KAF6657343.1 sensor histidine kinase [Paenibacillus sp. EKM301P]RPD97253.1 sensor histidine kinase [Paenibacillus polymyxa]UBS89763.1 sensor histidine kinase [Paenibacillus polymyxa]WHX38428.1 histidine kinase [Paenibacillus polymyxa]WOZ40992.1 histidine kinase [Paenibacillus polymyxa]